MSNSSASSVKVVSSLDQGITGHLYTADRKLGSKLECVPLKMSVFREHPSGCSSSNLLTNKTNTKTCLNCSSYPLRDTTNPCSLKYLLKALSNELEELEIEFSENNVHLGEALYRVMSTVWTEPGDILISLEVKRGDFVVTRSHRSPSKLQREKASALLNKG